MATAAGPEGWCDVQALLDAGAAALRPGEMLQSHFFSPFDAMSAVQMMEPRMDVGMDPAGLRSLEESLAAGGAPARPTAEQALELCECTWAEGHTLADTSLTCLYLQAPAQLDAQAAPVLAALLRGARASLGLALQLAARADVFEEEDLVTHAFGFDFSGEAGEAAVAETLSALADARALLAADGGEAGPPAARAALDAHCGLRAALLRCAAGVAALGECRRGSQPLLPPAHAHAIAASSAEAAGGEEEGEASEEELAGLRMRLGVALDEVHSQASLLQASPPTTPAGARCGFDPACSRRLLGGAVPRVIQLLSCQGALAAVRAHAAHISSLLSLAGDPVSRSLAGLVGGLDAFSRGELGGGAAQAGPPPSTLPRSAALLLLLPTELQLQQMVLEDMWAPGGGGAGVRPVQPAAPSAASAPPPAAAFLSAAARAADALLRAMCASRPRCRRRLRHVTAEWAPLCAQGQQAEAEAAQDAPPATPSLVAAWALAASDPAWAASPGGRAWAAGCLSSWAARWTARVQAGHLEAGLSLQLYGSDELGPLCWYLEYLCTVQCETLQGGEQTVSEVRAGGSLGAAQAAAAAAAAARQRAAALPPGTPPAARRKAANEALRCEEAARAAASAASDLLQPRPAPELRLALAQREMWSGYVRLLVALEAEGRLGGGSDGAAPPSGEGSAAWPGAGTPFHRFWQRYGTFHNYAVPPPLHYDQWEAHVASARPGTGAKGAEPPAPLLYKLATQRFRNAAAAFREAGWAAAGRVCAANAVAASLLAAPGGIALCASLAEEAAFRGWPHVKVASQRG